MKILASGQMATGSLLMPKKIFYDGQMHFYGLQNRNGHSLPL